MPRTARAAQRLIQDLQAVKPSIKAQPFGDPDGYGTIRTLKFDKRSSPVAYRILLHLDDARIADFHLTDAGYLHVDFVTNYLADFRNPFPIREAITVADAETPVEQEPADPPAADSSAE
jgi:hypothetical protein